MHVELHGHLWLALVGVPAGPTHRAVREGHQHAALHSTAAAAVLVFGQERVAVAVAVGAPPDRANQAEEALIGVLLPARVGGVQGPGLATNGAWRITTHSNRDPTDEIGVDFRAFRPSTIVFIPPYFEGARRRGDRVTAQLACCGAYVRFLAQSGPSETSAVCPLLGPKRT